MYKYKTLIDWVRSLDTIILDAKEKYKEPSDIAKFLERLYKLAKSEVNPAAYNEKTLNSSINVMLMQCYFRGEACTKRTIWFPQLIKFII